MKILRFSAISAVLGTLLFLGVQIVQAAVPMLTLGYLSGETVQVNVQGDPNAQVSLSYYGPYAAAYPTSVGTIGSTNSDGSFVTQLSSRVYGIPQGASVFVTVNGQRSPAIVLPNNGNIYAYGNGNCTVNCYPYAPYNPYQPYQNQYQYQYPYSQYSYAPITLSQSSIVLSMGETRSVSVYSQVTQNFSVQTNSNPSVASAYVSGSQVTITALSVGQTNVTLCSTAGSCATLSVTVNGQYAYPYNYGNQYPYTYGGGYPYVQTYPYQYQNQYPYPYATGALSLDRTDITVMAGETQVVSAYGVSSGLTVLSNGSANIASVTASGNMVYISGLVPGFSTVTVCATGGSCAQISVRVLQNSYNPYYYGGASSYGGSGWMYPWY